MTYVFNTVKKVREHWKKSIFFSVAVTYGVNYAKEKFESHQLMRIYCEEAQKYGQQSIPTFQPPRKVTVILNPNANKRKAKKLFDKYSAPLLHLAGLSVEIIMTESEGHAKTIIDNVVSTDAIIIAGGDGTVSEVITGLLRRCDNDASKNHCPIGVLPLGQSNTLAQSLFPTDKTLKMVRSIADATMAVVTQNTKAVDLMRIEIIDEKKQENKPVYAVGQIDWGVFRDAKATKDKYWYFGGLRDYATYVFNGMNISTQCEAVMSYSLPCEGCANCVTLNKNQNRRWWQKLLRINAPQEVKVANPKCKEMFEKEISATSLVLRTTNTNPSGIETGIPHLCIGVGPETLDYFEFVKQGWTQDRTLSEHVNVRQIEIKPSEKVLQNHELSIDNESFELKPILVTLLPKALQVFSRTGDRGVKV